MAFPLMALGAGLGIAADDINKQRAQQAQLQMQQMRFAREMQMLQLALQKYGQEQQAAQRIGSLTPPPLDGSGESQTPGMPPLPTTPGENQSPYASGMSIGGATDPASLVKRYESQGNYNVGFGGTDLSNAPLDQYGFPQWPGAIGPQGRSHAAGAYQFQPGTWGPAAAKLGIHDFSPASQDAVFNEVSRGGRDLSAWAPYNQALAGALNRPMPSPPVAPQVEPPGSIQRDAAGSYRVPTTYGSEEADRAIFGRQRAAQPAAARGQQFAQAGPQTATDAGPPSAQQQSLQLPPQPKLVDPAQYEAQLRAQVGSDIRTPEGRDYIAKSMAAVNAHNSMLTKQWEMDKARVEFQATQQNRAQTAAREERVSGTSNAFNAQITKPDGTSQNAMVFEKKGVTGFFNKATGEKLPSDWQVQKVGEQQAGLPAEVQFPDKWQGMPDKAPPGVRQDVWQGALEYAQTQKMPSMGMRSGPIRDQIFALQPAAAHALGVPASRVAGLQAEYAGERHAQVVLGSRIATIDTSIEETLPLGGALVKASNVVPRTDLGPFFNRWITGAQAQLAGSPEMVQFQGALNSYLNSYAKGINPTGQLTDTQQRHAYEVLNTAMSKGAIQAGVEQLNYELQVMREGLFSAAQQVPQMFQPPALQTPRQMPIAPQDRAIPQQGAPGGGGAGGEMRYDAQGNRVQ